MSLHVAINAVSTESGGGLTVLLELLRGWQEAALPVRVTVVASTAATISGLSASGTAADIIEVIPGARTYRAFTWQLFGLPRLLGSLRPDVVLCTNHWLPGIVAPLVVHHQNLHRFVTRQASGRKATLTDALRNRLARTALRKAAANIFISDYLRQVAEGCEHASATRNYVIYNSVPTAWLAGALPAPGPRGHRLLAIQSAANHKDVGTLLRVLARLRELRRDLPWHLDLLGHPGKRGRWEPYRHLATQLQIADHLTWHGAVAHDELPKFYRRAACFISTSWLEGFGLPMVEAMACGCPVVAAASGAVPEIAGDAARLVAPGDSAEFAEVVCRLVSSDTEGQRLVKAGTARCKLFRSAVNGRAFFDVLAAAAVGTSIRQMMTPVAAPDRAGTPAV